MPCRKILIYLRPIYIHQDVDVNPQFYLETLIEAPNVRALIKSLTTKIKIEERRINPQSAKMMKNKYMYLSIDRSKPLMHPINHL